jgi:hypothetical protein
MPGQRTCRPQCNSILFSTIKNPVSMNALSCCHYTSEECSDLLYVHRSYFARAIQDNSANPLEHDYSLSVMAVVRSAHRIITLFRDFHSVHSTACSRIWFIWSGLFASCVSTLNCRVEHDWLAGVDLPGHTWSPCRRESRLPTRSVCVARAGSSYFVLRHGIGFLSQF